MFERNVGIITPMANVCTCRCTGGGCICSQTNVINMADFHFLCRARGNRNMRLVTM